MKRFGWWVVLFSVAVMCLLARFRLGPPPPKSLDAPEREFSAARAMSLLGGLVGNGHPHPVGSAEDDRIREGLLGELRRLGYEPQVKEATACGMAHVCARTRSVLATLAGREPGPGVVLNAHYDSVEAGPGASDDGSGVAALLETARALKKGGALQHDVTFLFNEGEEDGLIGAEGLMQDAAFRARAGVVLNLEARGTQGASLMFETSEPNGWLVDLYARAVERPATNSLYYALYKLLPNDTDLTVFKRSGLPGMGFAFIGGADRYHTPLDDLAHLDPGSLQHQGQNALAMARALAESDLAPRGPDQVFFDVFGWMTLHARASAMLPLALASLLLVIAAAFRRRSSVGGVVRGALAFLLGLAGSAGLALLVRLVAHAEGAAPYAWIAHPTAARVCYAALGLACALTLAAALGARSERGSFCTGIWLIWGALSVAVAVRQPMMSHVLVLPAAAAGLFGFASALRPSRSLEAAALLGPLWVALALWIPVGWPLYEGMGLSLLPAEAVVAALAIMPCVPLVCGMTRLARWGPAALMVALAAGSLVAWIAQLPFSPKNPRHINIGLFVDADAAHATWFVDTVENFLPKELAAAAPFSSAEQGVFPWNPLYTSYVAPAPGLTAEAPEWVVESTERAEQGRHIRARLSSRRGARAVGILVPEPAAVDLKVAGQAPINPKPIRYSPAEGAGFVGRSWATLGQEGVRIELTVPGDAPLSIIVWDDSLGLPPQGEPLQRARPADAVPSQGGDRMIVARHVQL